ncbi:capsular polysaccharide export protein, LipB/KpsS family [Lacinutrix chionoecetis]
MTLLFVENRYKTYFFEAIALELAKKGFDIHFLIQNKNFLPKKKFTNHKITYPKRVYKDYTPDKDIALIIESDRQQNHFKKRDQSYFYYYNNKIEQILNTVKPDFVFGESTAFHELLTINLCKKKDILYLNPSTCRYPLGRFSFYKYDTLEPFKGSGEVLETNIALQVVDSIVNRTAKPDYMKALSISKKAKIADKIKLVKGFVEGESFNTPHPITKFSIEQVKRRNIKMWDEQAMTKLSKTQFLLLYPLQMQPEANIDVWGRAYRNQSELINALANAIPEDVTLVVKPNPKSKYELSAGLLDVVKHHQNIICLAHSTKMDDVLKDIDLVVTVTGTIAIECILSNKPVVTMVKTLNNKAANCLYLPNLKDLDSVISKVKSSTFITLKDNEKANFINALNSTSFKGIISDPYCDANCVGSSNIENVEKAFLTVLESK